VGSRARLDGCGKSRPPLGFDPQTVQPVASRYTCPSICTYTRNVMTAHCYWVSFSAQYNVLLPHTTSSLFPPNATTCPLWTLWSLLPVVAEV
jgi:hypothetical protein